MEELGLSYNLTTLNLQNGEHKAAEYKKIHPMGLVPAMTIDNEPLFESAAMCLALADAHPEKNLAPSPTAKERGQYYQWIFFSCNHLEPQLMDYFLHTQRLPEAQRDHNRAEAAKNQFTQNLEILAPNLDKNNYLLGANFSVADILVGSSLMWANMMKLVENKAVLSYLGRIQDRPAFQKIK
jgi:glutathione S-transferase